MKMFMVATAIVGMLAPVAHAESVLLDKEGWKFSVGGFAELDMMRDSTRSFREIIGNGPVVRSNSIDAANPRFQESIRNSRLSFTAQAPEVNGWRTKGFLEIDFFGYNPQPGTPAGAANAEASLFNNAVMRDRHSYLMADNGTWQILAGQTWQFFGWQPFYTLSTASVSPLPGTIFGRTAQLRAINDAHLTENSELQTGISIVRPPQADSGLPDVQAGLRWAYNGRTSGLTTGGSAPRKAQPMSLAVSGLTRDIVVPNSTVADVNTNDRLHASAVAFNGLLPVIATDDNKDVRGTLTLTGEYSRGSGYGDQFTSWTGNTASPLISNAPGNAAATGGFKAFNLDGGIGDYDANGVFTLIQLESYNAQLQYHLPTDTPYWFSAGYGRLRSANINTLTGATGATASGGTKVAYDSESTYFVNAYTEMATQLRVGLEYSHILTHYVNDENAGNDRYQASAYYYF